RPVELHLATHDSDVGADPRLVTDDDVAHFAPLAISAEADALLDYIDSLIARGVSVDSVLVDLLAPTARVLGEYWESDRCDFVDVTMGLWRLQEIVHELAARLPAATRPGARWRALFTPMPEDQHSFGSILLDEIFAREGWFTDRLSDISASELLDRVSADWFDLVGLTVGCESHMAALPSLITAVRNISANPQICVMVGGRIFVEAPARAAEVGADGTAPDARLAVQVASNLVGAVSRREFARG
ncbi:MAG: cobalamin-binding protein, partial [Sphingomonas sp.]|uniref:cobalamin B12-binding domain-containing protein n=1 Tax=Sphingomonas sp. TaxID=28214 RepID=UPI0025D968A7